ncbi:MAG: SH3 domain-containing protein [Thermomicrobiales bacterium]|nr:SH3 domain-containing protein [Thermomicrobiales bacterium]
MSTLLIMRTHRVLLFSLAAILIASLTAPMMGAASTDLAIGDVAVVSNNGNGANLRTSTTDLSDSTIAAELPDGAIVYVADGPFFEDSGAWVWVETDSYGGGYVSAGLLVKRAQSEEAPAAPEEPATVSEYAWLEPIDSGVVVDYYDELGESGLPVLNDAYYDAGVLGYAQPGAWFDVTSERLWIGDANFVRVNFNGAGAFVDGRFLALSSEAVAEEPVEEVIWIDEPVEEVAEVPSEEIIETEVVEVPVEDVTEVATDEIVETEVVEDVTEVATDEIVETEVVQVQAEDATEAPTDEIVEATPTEDVQATPTDEIIPTEDTEGTPTDEAVETATQDSSVETPTEAAATETTDDAAPTDVVEESTESVTEETATEAPVEAEVTVVPTEPVVIASTANSFDANTSIGSATVTGTISGLVCRASADPAAPALMTLAEGTKVQVFAEPVNGYLGIDCAGLQGYADVNYLWSGGAGDGEITAAQMSVVVTGTGSSLNCRADASLSAGVITSLKDGTVLTTRGAASNGWTPVICGGKNGFVSTTWIEVKAGASNNSNSGNNTSTTSGSAIVNTGGDSLYCRSGAGTTYGVITTLRNGASVAVRGTQQGAWLPVTCGGKAGFVHSDYVKVSADTSTPTDSGTKNDSTTATGTVTIANTGGQRLNCRNGAGTNSSVITSLALGQTVPTRSGSVSGWTAVVCGGQNGFVSSEFVSGGGTTTTPTPDTGNNGNGTVSGETGTATVNTGGDGLYCRTGAGSSYGVITTLRNGTQVTTRGAASNGWLPIICGSSNGWASATYLQMGSSNNNNSGNTGTTKPSGLTTNDHAKVSSSVNLRYEASMSSGVAVLVPESTVVLVTGAVSNNFYPVDYDGLKGFIHQDYLTKTTEALSKRGGSGTPGTTTPTPTEPTNPNGSAMVSYAMRYIGYPYVWSTHGPSSFDCSGFTYWVVKNVLGKDIGWGTWTQVAAGKPVSRDALQPGDLVFFQNTYTAGLSHVGMYIGNGQFIHAQNEATGVVISDLSSSYYAPRWYGAVRL